MILVGCDLHTRKQQVALLNTATGELRNQELSHIGDDVERFYGALSPPVTVGIESTGYSLWFHALLRWVLGQAAPLATRGDAALKRIYFAVLRRRGRPKAKVALARRLLVRLYVMLRDQIDYDEFCRRGRTQRPGLELARSPV